MLIDKAIGGYCPGKSFSVFTASLVTIAMLALNGCASTGDKTAPTADAAPSSPVDPYENINRKVFAFNDKVDNYVAEPIANAYKWATPQFMQTGVSNFFTNLKNINVVLNDLMQAKFQQSAQDTGRFLINTTAGVGGLFDIAKFAGLEQNDEDFEQTLAVWGVPQGSYLVIPFLGPSTARGIPGSVFDTAANPATYVGLPVQLVSMLNSRANAEGALKFIDEAALDPYVFTRESFLQWRQNLATDGKSEAANDLADFEDELLDNAAETTETVKPQSDASGAQPAAAQETSKEGENNTAPEVQGAVSAEPQSQRVASESGAATAVSPASVVAPAPVIPTGGVQNTAFREAKSKYELARLEYQMLKAEAARKRAAKARKAK